LRNLDPYKIITHPKLGGHQNIRIRIWYTGHKEDVEVKVYYRTYDVWQFSWFQKDLELFLYWKSPVRTLSIIWKKASDWAWALAFSPSSYSSEDHWNKGLVIVRKVEEI
jgi:hypothetical protein